MADTYLLKMQMIGDMSRQPDSRSREYAERDWQYTVDRLVSDYGAYPLFPGASATGPELRCYYVIDELTFGSFDFEGMDEVEFVQKIEPAPYERT